MTVTIDGVEYPIKFNQYALEHYARMIDWDGEITTAIYAMVWAGLKGGAFVQMKELDISFEQVTDWVDKEMQGDSKVIIEMSNLWTENYFYKKWLKAVKEAVSDKKKA